MKAKEYLLQIKRKDIMINSLIKQKDEMWAQLYSLSSPQYDNVSVQGTKDPDKFGALWAKIDAKERKISQAIDELADEKQRIMKQIDAIEDERFVEILLRRYVHMEKLEDIARDMNYSYDHMRHLHGFALAEFSRIHLDTH